MGSLYLILGLVYGGREGRSQKKVDRYNCQVGEPTLYS